MSESTKPGEVPDTQAELAEIHERQKARGKDEPVKMPPPRWETTMGDQVVEAGILPQKEESPE